MNPARIIYRTRQFWRAMGEKPSEQDLELVMLMLTPSQISLFKRMAESEQVHSICVLRSLLMKGEKHLDLLTAALLHDVGKSCFPLKLWERVIVVLAKAVSPNWVRGWGSDLLTKRQTADGWRRGFIVSENHAHWGAQMAAKAGASPLAVALIKRHQEEIPTYKCIKQSLEERLLHALQVADEES